MCQIKLPYVFSFQNISNFIAQNKLTSSLSLFVPSRTRYYIGKQRMWLMPRRRAAGFTKNARQEKAKSGGKRRLHGRQLPSRRARRPDRSPSSVTRRRDRHKPTRHKISAAISGDCFTPFLSRGNQENPHSPRARSPPPSAILLKIPCRREVSKQTRPPRATTPPRRTIL